VTTPSERRRFSRKLGENSMADKKKISIFQKIKRFWRETLGELHKVTWPTPKEAWNLTKIVLLVTVIMSILLGLMDFGFSELIVFIVSLV
jgi:preprotein translocase subunit SecE